MSTVQDQNKRGLLIVFEGVDRAGKSSQVSMLQNYFEKNRNEQTKVFRFPDRETKIGKELNEILKNYKSMEVKASHLLFSFNRWENREKMLDSLLSGYNVIVDRYAFSGVVYSVANNVDLEWCKYPDQGLLRPDIVFQLDLDINKTKLRKDFGTELYEKDEFQKKVRDEYKKFANYRYWRVIDADQEQDNVHKDVIEQLEILMKTYASYETDDFSKNFYPKSVGEDLFMYKDI